MLVTLVSASRNARGTPPQEHHVLWLREMTPAEIPEVGKSGPTIFIIEVGECDSYAAVNEWLKTKAPDFAGGTAVRVPDAPEVRAQQKHDDPALSFRVFLWSAGGSQYRATSPLLSRVNDLLSTRSVPTDGRRWLSL
jgi:hypothetical protein